MCVFTAVQHDMSGRLGAGRSSLLYPTQLELNVITLSIEWRASSSAAITSCVARNHRVCVLRSRLDTCCLKKLDFITGEQQVERCRLVKLEDDGLGFWRRASVELSSECDSLMFNHPPAIVDIESRFWKCAHLGTDHGVLSRRDSLRTQMKHCLICISIGHFFRCTERKRLQICLKFTLIAWKFVSKLV